MGALLSTVRVSPVPPARSWVDGRLVHVLTPNIYRTVAEAFQTFDYITKTGNFGFMDRELARWSGVAIMVRPTRQLQRLLSLTHAPSTVHAVAHEAEEAPQYHG